MKTINYVTGDATQPEGKGPKIIAHICNDAGSWGAGFVLAISARDRVPEAAYRLWAAGKHNIDYVPDEPLVGGMIQMVPSSIGGYADDFGSVWVCNMIAQCNTCTEEGPPIRYSWLATCLIKLRKMALAQGATVHMPRIGTGLAGGDWTKIEPLINALLSRYDVPVTVYDLA